MHSKEVLSTRAGEDTCQNRVRVGLDCSSDGGAAGRWVAALLRGLSNANRRVSRVFGRAVVAGMSWKSIPGVKPGVVTGDVAWSILKHAKQTGCKLPSMRARWPI